MRLRSLALAAAGLALTLAGCGGSSSGGTTPATLGFFGAQPTTAAAEAALFPRAGLRVGLQDAFGNFIPGGATVTLSLDPATAGAATLTGTSSVTTNGLSGIAAFPDVGVTLPGTGYRIRASVPGLGTITSTAFDVGAIPAIDGLGYLDGSGGFDFAGTGGTLTANDFQFRDAYYLHLDTADHRVFVADYDLRRVLVFNLSAQNDFTGVDRRADLVIGQANFTASVSTPSATGMGGPYHLAYDAARKRLFVGDYDNGRVLVYDARPGILATGAAATHVLGKPDFTTAANTSVSARSLHQIGGVCYDPVHDRLFVGDVEERILVFDVAPGVIANGAPAIGMLGRTDYTATATTPASATTVSYVEGMVYDAATDRLFVADGNFNRILVYDTAAITDGEAAIHVIGQADFTGSSVGSGRAGFNYVGALAIDAGNRRLIVSDPSNNRVLIFRLDALATGMSAIAVLGQAGFGTTGTGGGQAGLRAPYGLALDESNARLWTFDRSNDRLVIFPLR